MLFIAGVTIALFVELLLLFKKDKSKAGLFLIRIKSIPLVILLFHTTTLHSQSTHLLNINEGLNAGTIQVTHSSIDIGSIQNIFNGDNDLARSANINPFVVTLEFSNIVTLEASRIVMTAGTGEWSLACANTLEELNTGNYSEPFLPRTTANGIADSTSFIPVSCRYVQLTARRTSGDNYVHLNSWNLYAVQTITSLNINTPHDTEQFFREKDVHLTVIGIDEANGLRFELPNSEIAWNTSDPEIATVSNGIFKGHTIGIVTISAEYNGISQSRQLQVIEDPNSTDLVVSYIKRLPEIDFVENSTNPQREGWPEEGQQIEWKAYVRNFSSNTQQNITYRWKVNGEIIHAGEIAEILPYDLASASLPAIWDFNRKELSFEIDTANAIDEVEKSNNTLTVFTDALSVGFYVEQYVYDYFHQHQRELKSGSNSWDDWAQFQVSFWNKMMQNAIFPMTPNGVLDRIRIDSIAVVPDGELPLHGGLASNNPNILDKTVDLQWGFPASLLAEGNNFYANHTDTILNNAFYYESSLFHELGHARYLHDVYLYDVHYGNNNGEQYIRIRENGEYIANTEYMPVIAWEMVHGSYYEGLMSDDYTVFDEYCAVLYNLKAGERALCGNMNSPCDINARINDLPENNYLLLEDQFGNTLSNADVSIYQVSYDATIDKWVFEDSPALSLRANSNGVVSVGKCPFTLDGHIDTYYNGCNELYCIVRVEHHNRIGYQFLESSHFNMEFWKGNVDSALYTFQLPMVSDETSKTIDLNSGWNLISLSLYVNNKSIDSVFASILPSIESIKTEDGFYSSNVPSYFNTLEKIEDGKAYLINMNAPATFTYLGSSFNTSQIHYGTISGWQLLGSIHSEDKNIETFLLDHNLSPTTVKNFTEYWQPNGTFNSLQTIEPSKGYYFRMEE